MKGMEDIVDIKEIVYDHVLFVRCAMCEASMYGKKISDTIPEDGAPIVIPLVWIIILYMLVN
jgi:hypothetical protein